MFILLTRRNGTKQQRLINLDHVVAIMPNSDGQGIRVWFAGGEDDSFSEDFSFVVGMISAKGLVV